MLTLPLLLSVLQPAHADPLTRHAPTQPHVTLRGAAVLDADSAYFNDLEAGAPLAKTPMDGQPLSLGLSVSAATTATALADGRSPAGIRNVGTQLWLTLLDEDSETTHSALLGLHVSPSPSLGTSWYLRSPTETGLRASLAYDGHIDLPRFDLDLEAYTGFIDATAIYVFVLLELPIELGISGVAWLELSDAVALGAGTTLGSAMPFQTAVAAARLRPLPGTEIGLSVGLPWLSSYALPSPTPALELRIGG